jgi:hypothetical protein
LKLSKLTSQFLKVKTLFVYLLLICIYRENAFAQTIELGIRGGPNLNQLRGNDFVKERHQFLFAFTAGAFGRFTVKNKFSVLSALQFERNGSKIPDLIFTDQFGNNMGQSDLVNFLDFLVLPIMAEYRSGQKVRVAIHGGPFVGYLLNQHYEIKWNTGNQNGPKNSWDLDRFNFGLSGGAGVTMPLYKKLLLDISLEDHLGLSNLNNGTFDGKLRTNSTQFTIGVSLPLK